MTTDEIIRLAREAGIQQRHATPTEWWCWEASIERFAALVAEAEREACLAEIETGFWFDMTTEKILDAIAAAIRARGAA